ncbi:MAG TPA: nickel pincer cofactor biosynthesis protein LarB [Actinomycetota bacterium]
MDQASLSDLLHAVSRGDVGPEEAAERLAHLPVVDLGFAHVDTHRALRTGLPEVVYCPGKTPEQIRAIAAELLKAPGGTLLATRATERDFEAVRDLAPDVAYDAAGRIIVLRRAEVAPLGTVAVVTAGTADLPVAREATVVAEALGIKVEPIADIGVAGLHRALARQADLRRADVVIVVAGMEGALPSVVAGMVRSPVVAVPTSVGYGASFGGVAALLAMLSSCAAGISVVNIDNGFGAAVVAARILAARP